MPARIHHFVILASVIGILPLFFVDLGAWRRVFAPEVHVFGHLLFFAALAWLALQLPVLRRRSFIIQAVSILIGALVLGSLIELIQPYFGRSASFRDIWQNVLGAAIAVALHAPRGRTRRLVAGAVIVILAAELHVPGTSLWDRGVARTQFPVLSDFSTPLEQRRWWRGTRDTAIARYGSASLKVELKPGRIAGTAMVRSLGDWSQYETLELSIYIPGEPMGITISARDREHVERGKRYSDRFNRQFLLQPGWNEITIPTADIRDAPADRQQNLGEMVELAIVTTNLEQERILYVDRVRMTR